MTPTVYTVALISFQFTTHLSTPKGWKAELAWPVADGLPTIVDHPSAAGRAWDRESSPARDRRSTTVPRNQLIMMIMMMIMPQVGYRLW